MDARQDLAGRVTSSSRGVRRHPPDSPYVEQYGHARVPVSYTVDGYKLGQSVSRQRGSYANGVLDSDRQRRLEELPGWTWDPHADNWEEGFTRLVQYVEHNGHARVPQSYKADSYNLGLWVTSQRRKHATGVLEAERQRRLEELPGWTSSATDLSRTQR
jgi:Helicase associated domain